MIQSVFSEPEQFRPHLTARNAHSTTIFDSTSFGSTLELALFSSTVTSARLSPAVSDHYVSTLC